MENIILNNNQTNDIQENNLFTNTLDNDLDNKSDNESDNESKNSDNELINDEIDCELLKKIKEYEEEENKDISKITTNKSIEEIKNESSILTKQELIKLGQSFAAENIEKEIFEEKKQRIVTFLKKYENIDLDNIVDDIIKNKKNCNLKTILEHLFEYKRIYDNEINIFEGKMKKYSQEISEIQEENKSNIKENEDLNNQIETYWDPKVINLRNNVIEKNENIQDLYKVLYISNLNTLIVGYFGWNKYSYIIRKSIFFICDMVSALLKNIIFLSYMIFNNLFLISFISLFITIFIFLFKNYTNHIKIFKTE